MVVRGSITSTSCVSHRRGRWRILWWFLLARRYPGRIRWCIHWRLQRRDPIFKGANPPPHVGIDGVDFIEEGLPFLGEIICATIHRLFQGDDFTFKGRDELFCDDAVVA